VPDARYKWLVEQFKPKSEVPAFLTVTDIAGLIKGAHEGEGLGNEFLSNISAVDGIFHMVRIFDDPDVTHVEDSVDPVRDIEIIHNELIQKDLAQITRECAEKLKEHKRNEKLKEIKEEWEVLDAMQKLLEAGKPIRLGDWNAKQIEVVNQHHCITAKSEVFLLNMSERDFLRKKNKWLPKVHEAVTKFSGEPMIPFSVDFEAKLVSMQPEEREAYLKEVGATSVFDKIIKAGRDILKLQSFFTCGADEVRQWTIRQGFKAPQAAGTIHTDFEKGFICADVTPYDAMFEAGGEAQAKAAGKTRQQGKDYEMVDGDVCFFKFNPSGGGKGKK